MFSFVRKRCFSSSIESRVIKAVGHIIQKIDRDVDHYETANEALDFMYDSINNPDPKVLRMYNISPEEINLEVPHVSKQFIFTARQ
jgi:hypothetical protein